MRVLVINAINSQYNQGENGVVVCYTSVHMTKASADEYAYDWYESMFDEEWDKKKDIWNWIGKQSADGLGEIITLTECTVFGE